MRIGVVSQHQPGWLGGTMYTRMLLRSLAASGAADVALFVESDAGGQEGLARIVRIDPPSGASVERRLGAAGRIGFKLGLRLYDRYAGPPLYRAALAERISVMLPLQWYPNRAPPVAAVGWIPDFQHRRMQEQFSEAERARRDRLFASIAERSTLVMLSSRAAERDFAAFAPAHAEKARVLPFPSLFAFEPPGPADRSRLQRLRVPDRFALVVNQFWAHKNHECVLRALALAKQRGLSVPTVFVGVPADYRDPTNAAVSRLLQLVAELDLRKEALVLGEVGRAELIELLRAAAVVIQPSRSEGWSTTVQDALALGRPVLCSDLEVLREQAPQALGFFPVDAPEALAELLLSTWPTLGNDDREAPSLAAEQARARRHGEQLLALCSESHLRFQRRATR
jgi:glycosyltransferase involved in cell wall biosynthesis